MKTSTVFNLFSTLASLVILLVACGSPSISVAKSEFQRVASPNIPPNDFQMLPDGNNAFALDIYQSLRSRDGNIILSPYSISLALGMTYTGARGETEAQMAKTLHYDLPQGQLHPAFNSLDQTLAARGTPKSEDETPL